MIVVLNFHSSLVCNTVSHLKDPKKGKFLAVILVWWDEILSKIVGKIPFFG
jgi:hypothetical protein